jgi:triosephosphate isomerase
VRLPALVVNFKAYEQALGRRALSLARTCEEVGRETGASIVVCPALPQLAQMAAAVKLPVFAQHVDPVDAGSVTGHVPPKAALDVGAAGTLLNHAEHKVEAAVAAKTIALCRGIGLEVVACANDLPEAKAMAAMGPEFVAVEPPELIGGDVSVTSAKPEVVRDAVEAVHGAAPKVQVLCGAGVKGKGDVRKALELGAVGVLLASGVVLAKDPETALRDLVAGF